MLCCSAVEKQIINNYNTPAVKPAYLHLYYQPACAGVYEFL